MHRYETLEQLGNGSFGEVVRARSRKTNEVVAIKKMKALFPTWEECLQLRELKSLRVLRHENIVQLKEVIQDKEELYFVFEYMHSSLCKVMRQMKRQQQPATGALSSTTADDAPTSSATSSSAASAASSMWFSEAQIRSIMYQLFCGLAHMHKHGFFHRDIKPENLLCHDETLKIADLGQAREIRSRPPFTDYVSTRWYRSPELLLRATAYNSPIDLWACGCIMAELYLQTPLFPGSSEADQMCRICKVLGTPTKENWPDGMTMVAQMQFKFPKCAPVPWSHVLPPSASKAAIQLIQELLQYDPSRRLTASQALQHRFFDQSVARPMLTTATTASQSSSSSTASHAASSAALPVKAEYKSTVSYAAACSYGSTVSGASSKKAVDETLASESSSRWARKDLSAASSAASNDALGSSRKEWSSSSAYDLASTASSSSAAAAHWSAKQTAAAMDKLFVQHSPRESESWAAEAKTSRRERAGVGAKIDTTLAAAAKQRDARTGSDSYSSARKFSPSPEDEDDDNDHNELLVRDATDQERQRRRGDDHAQREDVATHRAHAIRMQSEDHLLQDLLDEFIA